MGLLFLPLADENPAMWKSVSNNMLFVLWQGNIVLSNMTFHLVLCYSSTAGEEVFSVMDLQPFSERKINERVMWMSHWGIKQL